jgi:hypothetical protein
MPEKKKRKSKADKIREKLAGHMPARAQELFWSGIEKISDGMDAGDRGDIFRGAATLVMLLAPGIDTEVLLAIKASLDSTILTRMPEINEKLKAIVQQIEQGAAHDCSVCPKLSKCQDPRAHEYLMNHSADLPPTNKHLLH